MKKPDALLTLLEELKNEDLASDLRPVKTAEALIYVTDDAVDEEDPIKLNHEECALVFANQDTVERLLEALEYPKDATLTLVDLNLDSPIIDYLERRFVAVDEG